MTKKHNGETFTLQLLPPPSRTLTAKQAAEWLEGPHRLYTQMLGYSERGGLLVCDLGTMLQACAEAIRGRRVRIEMDKDAKGPYEVDFLGRLKDLATLASLPGMDGYDHDTWASIRPVLAREVARRIGLLASRKVAAPSVQEVA